MSVLAGVCGLGGPAVRYVPRALRHRTAEQAALVDLAAQLRTLVGASSGKSVQMACIRLAEFGPLVLQAELGRVVREMAYADRGFPGALRGFQDRMADPVADQIVTACLYAHRYGERGLEPMLDNLVASTRQDQDVRREAEARKSQAYLATGVMCVIPVFTLFAVRTLAPDYLAIYDSPLGQLVLVGCAVWLALGVGLMLFVGRLTAWRRIFT